MAQEQHSQPIAVDIVAYEKALVRRAKNFRCGHPDLDQWLRQHAGQQQRRDNTRTFLAVPRGTQQVVGYYATTTYRIEPNEVSVELGAGHHAYPVPAVLLARLAVDQHWQGCGVGRSLLVDALMRIAEASRSVGFEVVVVDAIDADAVTFYARYGFTQFADHPQRLFLTTKQLVATVESTHAVD